MLSVVIVLYLNHLLTMQKKTDYKPRDEAAAIMTPATETCLHCIEYLSKMNGKLRESFHSSGQAYEIVQTEIMVAFHLLLLEHLKKYQITDTGGLLISK